ncbi:hypothetical protein BKA69DRAFT_1035108 [Paraphysoderma sedebokerense]|nr:hypothetical protein BKA69DRAFT_1035108 [Paraphysoderma sedebokerense]
MLAAAVPETAQTVQVDETKMTLKGSSFNPKTKDGVEFHIPEKIFAASKTVQDHLAKLGPKERKTPVLEVPHCTAETLSQVISWAYDHVEDTEEYDEAKWKFDDKDAQLKEISNEELLQLTLAADIFQIPAFLRLTAEIMASRIADKTPEEIRTMFNVDELAEEEMQIDAEEELEEIVEEKEKEKVTAEEVKEKSE